MARTFFFLDMSFSRQILGFVLCGVVGAAVGFWFGKHSAPQPQPIAAVQPAKPTRISVPSTAPKLETESETPETGTAAPVGEEDQRSGTLEEILAIKLIEQRHRALADYARELADKDLAKAIEGFHSLRNVHDKAVYLDGLIDVYARVKPMESLEFLRSLPGGFFRNVNTEKALAIIAETSPQVAAEQIPSLMKGADAHNALIRVSDVWAQNNPQEAMGWATLNLNGANRQASLEQMASTWANSNPTDALNYVANAAGFSAEDRELALRAIAGTWAMSEPEAAVAWAENHLRTSGSAEALQVALMNFATSDPAAAAARATQITDRNAAGQIYPAIASTWGSVAPAEAAAWVNTLPQGDGKGGAVMQLVESWANVDPAGAIRWAQQLPRIELSRDDAIRQAAMTWDRFNSGQMEQFLNDLTPAQAEEIRNILMTPQGEPPPASPRSGKEGLGRD
jgi:hypothetical protein